MGNSQLLRTIDRKLSEWSLWLFGPPSKMELIYKIRRNKLLIDHQLKLYGKIPHMRAKLERKKMNYDEMERALHESQATQRELELRQEYFARLECDTDQVIYLSEDRFDQQREIEKYKLVNEDLESNRVEIYDEDEEEESARLALTNELPNMNKPRTQQRRQQQQHHQQQQQQLGLEKNEILYTTL
jgi:hypothetical protein